MSASDSIDQADWFVDEGEEPMELDPRLRRGGIPARTWGVIAVIAAVLAFLAAAVLR